MKINCIIIEDEPLAMERTRSYVSKLPFLNLAATFEDALSAMELLNAGQVDLVFLDIHLGEFSGIQLLESSAFNSQFILTTAYHQYAVKGFELKVADYLLKPFTFERFVQAVSRAQENLNRNPSPVVQQPFLFVKTESRLEKVFLDEIRYIEGMGNYRRIHLPGKSIMTLQTFTELEQKIPADILCRVHKSYMVALARIDSVERDRIRIGEQYIPISETYRQAFFERINSI